MSLWQQLKEHLTELSNSSTLVVVATAAIGVVLSFVVMGLFSKKNHMPVEGRVHS